MPSPALIVGGVIIAVGAGFAFKQFVYDPYLAERVHELLDEFHDRRANRHGQLVEPHSASPGPRGKRSPTDFMSEKRASIGYDAMGGGSSTGTEMREVTSVSSALRRRAAPFQRNSSELEMGVIGQSFPPTGIDSVAPTWQSPPLSDAARQETLTADVRSSTPVQPIPTPPATASPRSPFSDLRALSEISFDAPSSSDPLDYQFSPPVEVHATFSPTAPTRTLSPPALFSPPASVFSPFVLPNSPPSDPFVDVPAPSQRPTSPWSELSAHSGATAGQLHLRLSRTDSDSEQDRRSDSGSDGSWEHT
ncbi:transmembrane protein [Ceratobasidium sp. AG-Ba]|nr:transmembrane protein [Ceratobasidium sp. AG-Ba]